MYFKSNVQILSSACRSAQRKNLVHDLDQDHAQDQDGKIIAAKFLVS